MLRRTPFFVALRLSGMMSRLVSQLILLARNSTARRSALHICKKDIHYRLFGASVPLAGIVVHQNVVFKLNSCTLIPNGRERQKAVKNQLSCNHELRVLHPEGLLEGVFESLIVVPECSLLINFIV